MKDLPENHFQASGNSWVNISNYYYYYYYYYIFSISFLLRFISAEHLFANHGFNNISPNQKKIRKPQNNLFCWNVTDF